MVNDLMEQKLLFKIAELEDEKKDLERQVNEQKAKCEAIEKRELERRQVEEKKHAEEVQFLKRTNQQLKVSGGEANRCIGRHLLCPP